MVSKIWYNLLMLLPLIRFECYLTLFLLTINELFFIKSSVNFTCKYNRCIYITGGRKPDQNRGVVGAAS